MHPIKKWCPSETDEVSNHLKKCPFNVKQPKPKKAEKSKAYTDVIQAIKERHKLRKLYS
jgi:hypothetical protein